MMDRVLTDVEQHYCKTQAVPAQHVAARLAAKEAAFKALQAAGARAYVGWREIEVRREAVGAPTLAFHQRAKECAETLGVVGALVSLSHSNTHAVAVVLLWA
jgi:holo-[acyl-carrier protein] synthase